MFKYIDKNTGKEMIIATMSELFIANEFFKENEPKRYQSHIGKYSQVINSIHPDDLDNIETRLFCDLIVKYMQFKWYDHDNLCDWNDRPEFFLWENNCFISKDYWIMSFIENICVYSKTIPFGKIYKMEWGTIYIQYEKSNEFDTHQCLDSYASMDHLIQSLSSEE